MRIKMRTTSAGPAGVMLAGAEYNVSDAQGKALCAGNYAVPVEEKKSEPKPKEVPAAETAAAPEAPESADMTPAPKEKPSAKRHK